MSIPPPGTYRIRSAQNPNQVLDLKDGSSHCCTHVIGHGNNYRTQNMLWTLQVIDRENGFVRLINVASGTFAQPASFGSGLVGSHHPWICKIVPRNNLGEYSIQTTNGELACSLADANDHTQVTLQGTDNNNHTQGWIFCSA